MNFPQSDSADLPEGTTLLESALEQATALGIGAGQATRSAWLGESYLRAGRPSDATRLAHQADPVGLGDARHGIGGGWILLAAVVQGAMWLHIRDRYDCCETGDLERDERLDLVR